jgi:hypothetical protein
MPGHPENRPDAANSLARRWTYASCSFFRRATQIPAVIARPSLQARKLLRALVCLQPLRGLVLDPRFGLAAGKEGTDVLPEIRPLHAHEPPLSPDERLGCQLGKAVLHAHAYARAARQTAPVEQLRAESTLAAVVVFVSAAWGAT